MKESEKRYRQLIEASQDLLVTVDLHGHIVDTNEAAVKLTGASREALIGSDFFGYFTEPAAVRAVYRAVLDHQQMTNVPCTLRHATGTLAEVLLDGTVNKNDQGQALGAVLVAREVAEKNWATELGIANKELAFQNHEKEKRADELSIANEELAFQNDEKEKRAAELSIANEELAFQNDEKSKRAAELGIANEELAFQNDEKEKRAAELVIANKELAFQNDEKEKRAQELGVANKELAFQNDEKEKRAAELVIANKELAFQNDEKEKRAQELGVANTELAFQNDEKEKRAQELGVANTELAFQNDEKEKRAQELSVANEELAFQNNEKEKRAQELSVANTELAFQNDEKEKRAQELSVANTELAFQNDEKEKRAQELSIANTELAFQNDEKEKRAQELSIANIELAFQNDENEKRAAELVIANTELAFQNDEKVKRAAELRIANYARSLIEASRDPLVTISPEGKITDMNSATVYITGIEREQLLGSDFFTYFTEPQMAREVYQEVFAKGTVADSPLTLRHKDGKLTDVLFNGSVYKNDEGHVLGVVIVARDVTDQKRIATELTEAKIAAERATELAEEAQAKAESATQIAEDAVKAKQQFLSNMSHEIRTPMNAIIGFTKVLLKTELTDKQHEYLTAIKLSGDTLIVLINDILDLAKVDAGRMTFEQIPFKLSASVAAMVHLFETKIQEKNLELVMEYDEKIPEVVVGDPVRLHQIILNLVSNAVKFTSEGSITVGVRMLVQDAEKVILEFAVTDTGIGIEQAKLGTVFDTFQQATSGTSRLYGGTGLGLAIVKNLVEPQGGTINVKSRVGAGSTFSFILSFNKTLEKADAESNLTVELESGFKDVKILVVEDIALNQLLMKTLLEDFGFAMEVAGNGQIAVEKMATTHFDIVLMDLQMPVMNGFEATEYIRTQLHSTVPIIALTADVTTVDVEKCKAVGMNDYISKPIDDKLLYSKIIKYLKSSGFEKEAVVEAIEAVVAAPLTCVNFEYLRRITKSDARMAEMIYLYLQEIPPLVQTMKAAIAGNEWQALKLATHSIIPTFATMGINPKFEDNAKALQALAGILLADTDGTGATAANLAEVHRLFLKIETVCEQAAAELEEKLQRLSQTLQPARVKG